VHLKVAQACRKVGTDVLKIGTQGKSGESKALPLAGTSRVKTFFWGAKRWAHRVLPKEEKKVKGGEVVVRHGRGDRGLPLALEGALQDTVDLAKSVHNCLEEQKKQGVKRGAKAFWGGQTWRTEKLAMAEGRYVKGEHMVMVWCTGTRCEGQGKKKSDGQQKRKKGTNDKTKNKKIFW
jgi:hypothetical protein